MGLKTPLYAEHLALQAKVVDFAGWDMPLHYGSQLDEHKAVRQDAGMFDVSHMTVVDVSGADTAAYLRRLLANNVDRLQQPGKALYSCMLQADGGVIDDLIAYYLRDDFFRVVVNAATRDKDLAWMREQVQKQDVTITERSDMAMIAVQGPQAREKTHRVLDSECRDLASKLGPFFGAQCGDIFISRTGYTGEDGYELVVPAEQASALWRGLLEAGVRPAGLGSRDTLRLEAGMALYGTDMDETTSPLESGLTWTVAWEPEDRDFIGRPALETQRREGGLKKFVGLIMNERGMLRNHQTVLDKQGDVVGEITSGSFSPVLGKAIAFARVDHNVTDECFVNIRGKTLQLEVVRPPFVRNGKACYS